jgi:hypothetical protein
MPTPLPVVIGRPAFFGVSVINFAIYLGYHKSKPGGSTNFHPGSNPAERYSQMAKATRVHSTPRRTASKIHTTRKPKAKKLESAVAKVQKSGLELVRARKSRGKPATLRDYQTIDFKPWNRAAGEPEFIPSDEQLSFYGTNCRIAHAVCLKTRGELIAMHGKIEIENTDAVIAGLFETSEGLKELVWMCESASSRLLASAAAAYKGGIFDCKARGML